MSLAKRPNKGLVEQNLLSLSYGKLVRKDIEALGGLLPASFETYQVLERGDMVFRFTDLQNDQRSLRSALAPERGIITSAYLVMTPHGMEPRFVGHLMRAYDLGKVFYGLGGGVRQGLQFDDIRRLPVPCPPLEVQRRISDLLDRECERISALIHKGDEAARLSRVAFWSLQADVLLDADHADGETKLKYLVEPPINGTWGSDPGTDELDVSCVRVADFDRPSLTVREAPTTRAIAQRQFSRLRLRVGDLVLEKSGGGDKSPVGFVARVGFDGEAVTSNFVARVRPRPGHSSVYLGHLFGVLYALRRNEPFVKKVTGIQNLDSAGYLALRVPARSSDQEQRIASDSERRLQSVLALEARQAAFRGRLEEYRAALVTEAVTGQLDLASIPEAETDERLHRVAEAPAGVVEANL